MTERILESLAEKDKRTVELEAQGAEMRFALEVAQDLDYQDDLDFRILYGLGDDDHRAFAGRIRRHALSSDAGKGWLSPEKANRLRNALEFYADPENGKPRWIETEIKDRPILDTPYNLDSGRTARKALEE